MVAVAHSLEDDVAVAVFLYSLVIKGRESVLHSLEILLLNEASGDMSALLHQVGIVNLLLGRVDKGFDHCLVRIVDQDHDVGHLQGCALADPQSRRDTFNNGTLGGSCQ